MNLQRGVVQSIDPISLLASVTIPGGPTVSAPWLGAPPRSGNIVTLLEVSGGSWLCLGTTGRLGPGIVFDRRQRTAGNLTLNNTAWTDLNPGWDSSAAQDITLDANASDVIEVGIDGFWGNEAVRAALNVVCVTSGTGFGPSGVSDMGILGLRKASVSEFGGVNATYPRVLVGADLASGQVALRVRFKSDAATNATLRASTTDPLTFWAKNLGPQIT